MLKTVLIESVIVLMKCRMATSFIALCAVTVRQKESYRIAPPVYREERTGSFP